jgi:hypothetical protein
MQSTDFRVHVRGKLPEFNAIILTDVQQIVSVAETHRLEQSYVITLIKHEHQKALTKQQYID